MEQIYPLVKSGCLVWETEKPFHDVRRKSSNFWLLGYEWNFSLTLCYPSNAACYKITLEKLTDGRCLDCPLRVTVYVRNTWKRNCLFDISNSTSVEQIVWLRNVESADTALCSENSNGKWTITFIFDCDQPLLLHVSKNETELSSSRDKCVQACSDIPPDLESLSGDFRRLLKDETFTDVKLRCGERTISAHRSILAARSDVFTAMFRNKMAESETGTVDVPDVDSDVLDSLLLYVYSGKIQDLSEDSVSSLYEASDKYSIHALQKSCSDWMVGNLTAENCLGYLVLADAHSDEDFKDRVVDFAARSLESLKKVDWTDFNRNHPLLALSVCQRHLAPTLSKQS